MLMTYICYAKKHRINTEAILEATNPICNNRPPIQLFGSIFILFFLSIDFCCLKVTVTGFKSKSLTKIYWKTIALFGNGSIRF